MDARSRHLHNMAATRANEVRQRRATVENPQWAMSRPAEWYQNRENLASVKDTLTQSRGNRDFWTTDQDESRNMYQMMMNNMVGGGGARMLDLRGLPAAVQADPNRYRRGRTLFQDPSKSQGFFRDLASMVLRKPNPAAVRAKEWNPFHEEGYGRDFYIDEFGQPWGEKLTELLKFAPVIGMTSRFLPKTEKEPLPSDRSWIPEGIGSYRQVPMIDLETMDRDIDNAVGITGVVDDTHPERAEYAERTFGVDRHPDLPPSGRDLNPRLPPWAQGDRDMTTTDTDLATDPRPWLQDEIEDPLSDIDVGGQDLEVDLQLPYTPPFDEGREDFIRKQNEYRPIRRSTFVAPHDEFDPDQFRFDNYDEYYNYLRKKRGLGEFTGDYYQGFTYDPRVDGIPLDYIPSAPDLTDR